MNQRLSCVVRKNLAKHLAMVMEFAGKQHVVAQRRFHRLPEQRLKKKKKLFPKIKKCFTFLCCNSGCEKYGVDVQCCAFSV